MDNRCRKMNNLFNNEAFAASFTGFFFFTRPIVRAGTPML